MIRNIFKTIKNHKIIAITIAAVLAVIVTLVIILMTNGVSDSNDDVKAIARGNNTKCATVIVKADLPDGYYWHVDGFDEEKTPVVIAKETNHKLKIKIKGNTPGGYSLGISCNNQPEFESEEEEEEFILSHDAEELLYIKYLCSLSCDFTVNGENKINVIGIDAIDTLSSVQLFEDMPYPINVKALNNQIVLTVRNEEEDWTIENSNPDLVYSAGPYENSNGEQEFVIRPTADGSSVIRLINYTVNYGIQFDAISYTIYFDREGNRVTDTDLIVSSELRISMENPKALGENELIINYDELDKLAEIKEAVNNIPLPVGATVRDCMNMGRVQEDGSYDENAKDVSSIELRYLNRTLDYVISEKLTPDELLTGADEFMAELGAEKKVEKMGETEVTYYVLPLEEPDENTEEGEEPILYIACWQYEGVTCLLQEQDSTYNNLYKFVSTLELR